MNHKISYDLLDNIMGQNPNADPQNTNHRNWEQIKKVLLHVLREEISDRQREMMLLYFFKHMSTTQIAQKLQVNKSTVSRTIRRGISNLQKYTRYYEFRN